MFLQPKSPTTIGIFFKVFHVAQGLLEYSSHETATVPWKHDPILEPVVWGGVMDRCGQHSITKFVNS